MLPALLRTKLIAPRLSWEIVHRPALVQRLNSGLDRPLTLVLAPAGFGKTTLLAEWANQSPRRITWLTLDEGGNDLATFVGYFVTALQQLFPQACPGTQALLRAPELSQPETIALILTNEIDDLPERFVLVLDDYHFITDPAVHQLVNSLLYHPPLQMHLVFLAQRSTAGLAPAARQSGGERTACSGFAFLEARSRSLPGSHDRCGCERTVGVPRARFQFEILETVEAGLVLLGSEVKALREGKAQLQEAYARFRGHELFLLKCHIEEYRHGAYANHEPTRPRKLLLHATELARLRARVSQKGLTLVPLTLYFNEDGRAKLELALGRGRKLYDKREAIRTREARVDIRRASRR